MSWQEGEEGKKPSLELVGEALAELIDQSSDLNPADAAYFIILSSGSKDQRKAHYDAF